MTSRVMHIRSHAYHLLVLDIDLLVRAGVLNLLVRMTRRHDCLLVVLHLLLLLYLLVMRILVVHVALTDHVVVVPLLFPLLPIL